MVEAINGFQVLRKVADSNTAEIFHVIRLTGRGRGSEFAAKVLRPAFADSPVERGYLENEYRICSRLDHPNMIVAHEVQLAAPRPFLVLDLVAGQSLRQHIDAERLPLGPALRWASQMADGLGYFHELGYVHRDVKPQNAVVGQDGQVRVIDFALAVRQDVTLGKRLLRRLTERRRPGTWSYMSPEQIRNRRLTGLADLYSLGVTLFEMATGRLPYAAETPQELMEDHLYAIIPSIRMLRPEAPTALDDLIRAMMAKDPLDRPAGMQYVSAKLKGLAAVCDALGEPREVAGPRDAGDGI